VYLILLGAPGTGKGTQANILATRFGWLHVSTGDMLREAIAGDGELGKTVKHYMDQGALVPDDVVIDMLLERISRPDAQSGFILDGFPRNLAQAKALDEAFSGQGKSIDIAINLAVPDEELVERLRGRWVCRNCGAIYQEVANPPKVTGICDRCGSHLSQREDDRADTVRARLVQQKPPADMLGYYRVSRRLIDINGLQSVEQVTKDVLDALKSVPGVAS
jgi:adenylate kinase